MGVVLITHTDLDGISCAIIAKYFNLPDDILFVDYGRDMVAPLVSKIREHDEIWITDLCIEQTVYESLKGKEYTIIDHHEGTSEYADDENVVFDMTKSGTRLLFEHLKSTKKRIPTVVSEFVELVDTYDMWKDNTSLFEIAKKLHMLLYRTIFWQSKGYEKYKRFIVDQLMKFRFLPNFDFTNHEKLLIKQAIEKEKEEYRKAYNGIQRRRDKKGRKFGLIKAGSNVSSVCSKILADNPSMDYIICINTYKPEQGKVSGRTKREDFDLNDLNVIQGHARAAGGEFDPIFLDMLWEGGYNNIEEYSEFLSTHQRKC